MASKQENLNVSPGLVRRLLRENRTMGTQLAQYEFRRMSGELSNPTLFMLELDFPGETPVASPVLPSVVGDPVSRKLPLLNVNTGSVLVVENPEALPPMGIHIPDLPPEELRPALRALMTAHVSDPFARFVFLCDTFKPIPFLGRYKFVYEYLGETALAAAAERASVRFGISEVRSLVGTQVLWRKNAAETAE
ncbi:hypothetical protein [Yoonia litorea]|uniref:Uncharacterized protein n=1 Tax=Yoonia litorea TaxID=1123755 RepID=A0A1I6N2Y1_9RHOB|nr:hypothetical protein [Yoonia litorea]SFS22247.1 hypothetical protein SAMN05444714_3219 [Yoonia litorea]